MIITKSHNNYYSVGVMELCLLNLLILTDCFLCTSYPCVLFESLSHVINHEPHVYSWNLRKIYLVCFFEILKSPLLHSGDFKISKKVNSVNLSQISLLNMWLLVQIEFRMSFVITIITINNNYNDMSNANNDLIEMTW